MKEVSASGNVMSFTIDRTAIAQIDPSKCVNCGTCRDICPTEAIEELQRTVCRLCPTCTDRPAMTMDENDNFSTAHACTTECPLGISPQGYVNLTRLGQYEDAYKLIWKKNPLPAVCGRICHHPCEQGCKRGTLVDEPIAIRGIKRFLSDHVDYIPPKYPRIYDEEIAVIGAGPAGLTAAHYLSLAGYRVTVFDSEPAAGGMLISGIPKFRLPRDVVAEEVDRLAQSGIDFVFSEKIGKHRLEELKSEFDAVLVAAGAPTSKELKIDGWRKEGVMTALQFMSCVDQDELLKRHPGQNFDFSGGSVVVIGGGNVALDCARSAVRLGAKKVTCTCLESGDDVPCHEWERREAEEEGIEILEGWAPQRFSGVHNELTGVDYAKVVNFKNDGRLSFDTDTYQTMTLPADWVIVAVGQTPDSLWGNYYDEPNVFFAGDVKDPVNSVVGAMASGKETAVQIDEFFRGRTTKDLMNLRTLHSAPELEKVFPANRLRIARPPMPILEAEERMRSFNEVETDYSESVITTEANRCLQCGYQSVDPEKCIGCGACQRECPKGDAITMTSIDNGGIR